MTGAVSINLTAIFIINILIEMSVIMTMRVHVNQMGIQKRSTCWLEGKWNVLPQIIPYEL